MKLELAQIFLDGTLAALFMAMGLTDMKMNHCETGCLTKTATEAAWTVQTGALVFQQEVVGTELYVGYDSDTLYGPFQITYGASVKDNGGAWVGAGIKWSTQSVIDSPFFLEGSVLPGLYSRGNGPDLSSPLQFRSVAAVGYAFENGAKLSVYIDHRSNGDTKLPNPGIESLGLRYTIAVN